MSLFEKDGAVHHQPALASQVVDVSGAGDTVLSTLTWTLASGATPAQAIEAASHAAAVVVRSSSTRALINAAAAGAGIALLPHLLAGQCAGLVEIPAPRPIPARPVWLVTHRDLRRARPLRLVRDWIADAFAVARQ